MVSFSEMNALMATGVSYLLAVIALFVGLYIFSLVTRYHDWEEIKRGNVSAALATGGLLLGLANILRFAILSNNTPREVAIWSGVGIIGLMIGWWLFDLATPQFRTDDELKKDNRAVGVVMFSIFMAISFIVGASIS